MQYRFVILAALASTAIANPTILSKKEDSVCDQQRLTCGAKPGANQSLCGSQKQACDSCEAAYEAYITSPGSNKSYAASARNECFAASAVGAGDGTGPIISSLNAAHAGGATATPTAGSSTSTAPPPAGTTAASTCDQQRLECGSAPGANQSLCAVEKNACDNCEKAYEAYITSPGSNKAFAASLRNQCFAGSKVAAGDGVLPFLSSFSAAMNGGASSTAAPSPSSTGAAGAPGATTAAPTKPAGATTPVAGGAAPTKPATNGTSHTAVATPTPSTVLANAAMALSPFGAAGLLALGAALVL